MKTCIYCKKTKEENEFNREHIIPQAIGGASETNNPLIIEVCKRCNSIAGFFIDTPFVKFWFIGVSFITALREAEENKKINTYPFMYMGKLDDFKLDDLECEKWIGRNKEDVYHFHPPFPSERDLEKVGGLHPSFKEDENINHGFAILVFKDDDEVWKEITRNSFNKKFKKSQRYIVDFNSSQKRELPSDFPRDKVRYVNELNRLTRNESKFTFQISFGTGERFLAKTALSIGSLLFGEQYYKSEYADKLRTFLWQKKFESRKNLDLKVKGFIANKTKFPKLKPLFSLGVCHVIALLKYQESIELFVNYFSDNPAMIRVDDKIANWKFGENNQGMIYICHPILKTIIGPITLNQFLNHKNKKLLIPELTKLEK